MSTLTSELGIDKVTANLQDQIVSIVGNAAPSAIVAAIQATGRDAILRGSGKSDSKAPFLSLPKYPAASDVAIRLSEPAGGRMIQALTSRSSL